MRGINGVISLEKIRSYLTFGKKELLVVVSTAFFPVQFVRVRALCLDMVGKAKERGREDK